MNTNTSRKNRILVGIYNSSWNTSMITQSIVAVLEIFMLVYTVVNPPLFGQYMQIYRKFYISAGRRRRLYPDEPVYQEGH